MKDDNNQDSITIHCAIHREHLAAKYTKYDHVMKTLMEIAYFISSSANIHRQFKNCVEELDDDFTAIIGNYFCIARWQSTNDILNMFVYLFEPICTFFYEKGKIYEQL